MEYHSIEIAYALNSSDNQQRRNMEGETHNSVRRNLYFVFNVLLYIYGTLDMRSLLVDLFRLHQIKTELSVVLLQILEQWYSTWGTPGETRQYLTGSLTCDININV
jgi:hypothetical protein